MSSSGLLQPRGPRSLPAAIARAKGLVASGIVARVAVALLAPEDVTAPHARSRRAPAFGRLRHDCYGWSLLYQLPGMRGMAWIDPHERFADVSTDPRRLAMLADDETREVRDRWMAGIEKRYRVEWKRDPR